MRTWFGVSFEEHTENIARIIAAVYSNKSERQAADAVKLYWKKVEEMWDEFHEED